MMIPPGEEHGAELMCHRVYCRYRYWRCRTKEGPSDWVWERIQELADMKKLTETRLCRASGLGKVSSFYCKGHGKPWEALGRGVTFMSVYYFSRLLWVLWEVLIGEKKVCVSRGTSLWSLIAFLAVDPFYLMLTHGFLYVLHSRQCCFPLFMHYP